MEDDAQGPQPGGLDPSQDPVERLRQLEEEMLRLKQQLQPEEPDALLEATSPEEESPIETVEVVESPPTPEQLATAEDLIRQAMLARRRGLKDVAAKLMSEAEAAAPGAPAVLEAIGDDLAERGQTKPALEAYGRAMKAAPGNVALERKHAQLVFKVANAGSIEHQLQAGLGTVAAGPDSVASAKAALWLSLFLPGLGQMVTNRLTLGLTMLGGWLGGWIFAILIPDGLSKFRELFTGKGSDFNSFVFFPVGLATAMHFWSIFEAASKVPKGPRLPPPPRPTPPVDMPFE